MAANYSIILLCLFSAPDTGAFDEAGYGDETMKYKPDPIDTSDVKLPEEVVGLTEMLAKNAHEVWAAQRIQDGWRYGVKRDDSKKEHPCLLPYEELPEEEKQYDRNAAIESIKLIIKLGYGIKKSL